MDFRHLLTAMCITLALLLPDDLWARGFGGGRGGGIGGRSGGGISRGGGFGGGTMSRGGGFNRGGGGLGGGPQRSGGFSRGGLTRGSSGIGGGSLSGRGGLGGSPLSGAPRATPSRTGLGSAGSRTGFGAPRSGSGIGGPRQGASGGLSGLGQRGPGAAGMGAAAAPSRGQLNSFLGLPSDSGLHTAGSTGAGRSGIGGPASGAGVLPGVGVGGAGGSASGIGIRPGAGAGRPGVGAGGIGGPDSGLGVRPGAGLGRAGAGIGGVGGFSPVRPSTRYSTAAAVRNNYNRWGAYGRDWYTRYPEAWFASGWAADAAWRACTWDSAAAYCGYSEAPPVYYDYGNNVTYQGDSVFMNGSQMGTSEDYYSQAASIASAGATAEAPADGDWLPLGVFAFTKPGASDSNITIQLAVNHQGVIRGNYTDSSSNTNQVVQGSVDKSTQRAAFTVGDDQSRIIETGLYNLTKDEAPALVHVSEDTTEQWLLVRLNQPDTDNN